MAKVPFKEMPADARKSGKVEWYEFLKGKVKLSKPTASKVYDAMGNFIIKALLEGKYISFPDFGDMFLKQSERRAIHKMFGAPTQIVVVPRKYKFHFNPAKQFYWEIEEKSRLEAGEEWKLYVEQAKAARLEGSLAKKKTYDDE